MVFARSFRVRRGAKAWRGLEVCPSGRLEEVSQRSEQLGIEHLK